MNIARLDHLVLTVADIERTCAFYTRVLGMAVVTFGDGRTALRFGQQKINLHPADNLPGLVADRPTPGSGDLCFITEVPIADVVAAFLRLNVEQRSYARLLAWDGLADTTSDADEAGGYFTEMVDDLRRRQRAGELADDLDPAYVLLLLFAAALAPTVIPQIARRFTGLDVDSPTFQAAYAEQLRRVVERLAD